LQQKNKKEIKKLLSNENISYKELFSKIDTDESTLEFWNEIFYFSKNRKEIEELILEHFEKIELTKTAISKLLSIVFSKHHNSQGYPLFYGVENMEYSVHFISPPMHTLMGVAQNIIELFHGAKDCDFFKISESSTHFSKTGLEEDLKKMEFSNRSPWKREARLRHILSWNLLPDGLQERLKHLPLLFNWVQTEIYSKPEKKWNQQNWY